MSHRRLQIAVAVLLAIGFVLTAAVFILSTRALSGIRGDFCTYAAAQYKVTLELPQVPARVQAERNDQALEAQLGCAP